MHEKKMLKILLCNEFDDITTDEDGIRSVCVYVHNIIQISPEELWGIKKNNFLCLKGGKTFGNMKERKHISFGFGNIGTGWATGTNSRMTPPAIKNAVCLSEFSPE
eukprot:GHVQ01042023.1.p2 GENE.GHVQ01042023.1~~GHVQ01042023.1.p2  ORF type:complete len:106 (-),score=10.05 GHVQ01042023.1:836-1153(-)